MGNGDGMLSVRELGDVFKRIGIRLNAAEVAALMAEADVNQDGAIDLEELVAWLYGDASWFPASRHAPHGPREGAATRAPGHPEALGYAAFAAARAALAQQSGGVRFPVHTTATTFLSLERGQGSQVNMDALLEFIVRRANLHASYVELSAYDANGCGYLREFDVERFIAAFVSKTPRLCNRMEKEFLPFYVIHATRRILFLLDERGTGKISVRALVCSPLLSELQDLRKESQEDETRLARNWFSCETAMRLYSKFLDLDADGDGMLSAKELQKAGS